MVAADQRTSMTFKISAGDMGGDSSTLESRLSLIFVLEVIGRHLYRSTKQTLLFKKSFIVGKNGLVSVILRILEYFQEVIFLTTKPVQSFANSSKSRIMLAIRYDSLSLASRHIMWETFFNMATISRPRDVLVKGT